MKILSKVFETDGLIDHDHKLLIKKPFTDIPPGKVHILLIVDYKKDIRESEWLLAASKNPVFDFLKDPKEDIYSISDGKPFHD